MSLQQQEVPVENIGQSPGSDPKSKRNSGLFAFLKWFKPSTSRESLNSDQQNSHSSSCDSLASLQSAGTVASFSFVHPNAYENSVSEKCIVPGPETDTYKARLKQRDKRREKDKNVTLRRKYNLFFSRETFKKTEKEEENTKSLPLMTRGAMNGEEEKLHRRTNSESSKLKKAGAYLHVKGKRKAPQPPGTKPTNSGSTMSLKRKKRLAPSPPVTSKQKHEVMDTDKQSIEYADADVLFNDSLKLDHGILKPAKESDSNMHGEDGSNVNSLHSPTASARSSFVEAPVSPRPWYKRNTSRETNTNKRDKDFKIDHKYEPVERLPEVQYMRNSKLDLTLEAGNEIKETKQEKKKDEKRNSGMVFLTNISELDREATEIIKKEHQKAGYRLEEIPEFMKPREEPTMNTDSWVSPKRRSARDLIAKFNAITNVTKVTVNTALFGNSKDSRLFGKQQSLDESKKHDVLVDPIKKKTEQGDALKVGSPLMKSESASAVKLKPDTPKMERKPWTCRKCNVANDYWRIICHVCSSIKPYFDDFSSSQKNNDAKISNFDMKDKQNVIDKQQNKTNLSNDKVLERSKTQIGFSALASYNMKNKNSESQNNKGDLDKKEEKEKLKKMLIEMKNSLPKRKTHSETVNNRASVIMEGSEGAEPTEVPEKEIKKKPVENNENNSQEAKVAEILIGTKTTIYENIKVKKTEIPKPIKINSTSQQQQRLDGNKTPSPSSKKLTETPRKHEYKPMQLQDFENIYSDRDGNSKARIYANLAENDELSLFFNVPNKLMDLRNNSNSKNINTDTIEINRLLRKLETSIAKGDLTEAAIYAKELAQLKVNCSVIRQKPKGFEKEKTSKSFQIEMYVEDKISHRGPFGLEVTPDQTVAQLKKQVQDEFEIPVNVQRWILGKELATDDSLTLKHHNITKEGCPIFLYLVAPETNGNVDLSKTKEDINKPSSSKLPSTSSTNILTKNLNSDIEPIQKEVKTTTDHTPKIIKVYPKNLEAKKETVVVTAKVKNVEEKVQLPKLNDFKKIENPVGQSKTKDVLKIPSSNQYEAAGISNGNTVTNKSREIENIKSKDLPQVKNNIKGESSKIIAKKAIEEDFDDLDTKTLKPLKNEWECHLCTLLNPNTSNICTVCATVRLRPENIKKNLKRKAPLPQQQTYLQLVNLDNADLVSNTDIFECPICFLEIPANEGVTLRECLHQFCKFCLAQTVEHNDDAEVKCPYRDEEYSCNIALQDREIKALVTPAIYEQHLAKSVSQAENKIDKSFHCKTPDCKGWCIFEDNVNEFKCPVCTHINCLTCQAIHQGLNCRQYQERMNAESVVDDNAKQTKQMLEDMVKNGEAIACPTCKVILMKKWGCDWLRCSMCKTEICWVTRGPRWGPNGKGDTTGGCQCGVNGVKCHPKCNYCH